MTRDELLRTLARHIDAARRPHPTRVAIDGVDAAGKTTLADELVAPLEALGRPVIRASGDAFGQPAAIRYRRGRMSGEGYFHDAVNHAALVDALLAPLGPGGTLRYRRVGFDILHDQPIDAASEHAPSDAVLLVDGVFLLRDELRPFWDVTLFVQASFDATLARAEARDAARFGGVDATRQRYLERYIPGQRLYLAEVDPERRAQFVVRNDDPTHPQLISHPGTTTRS